MKITGGDVIKNGERDLMDAITADLDWGAVEGIFRERHNLNLEEDIEYKKGDIVVHKNEIAYRLDFLAKVTLSVLLDRDGNYLSVDITGSTSSPQNSDVSGEERGQEPPESEKEGYEQVISRLGADDQDSTVSDPEVSSIDSESPEDSEVPAARP
jgi:hypothetical protein